MEQENKNEPLNKVKAYFIDNYIPCNPSDKGAMFLSLEQIFNSLNSAFPVPELSKIIIFSWLEEGKFLHLDMTGTLNFKWVLKNKN